jgi:hypothetical protein
VVRESLTRTLRSDRSAGFPTWATEGCLQARSPEGERHAWRDSVVPLSQPREALQGASALLGPPQEEPPSMVRSANALRHQNGPLRTAWKPAACTAGFASRPSPAQRHLNTSLPRGRRAPIIPLPPERPDDATGQSDA